MTRYALRLLLDYRFDRPAGAGRQMLRILPAYLPPVQQFTLQSLTIKPDPVEFDRFYDFFDTQVIELALPAGLTHFQLEMRAEVTREARLIGADVSPPVAELGAALRQVHDLQAASPHHFRPTSRRVGRDGAIMAFAKGVNKGQSTLALIEDLGLALHRQMTFDANATKVETSPSQAFALRRGVCQDFAHILISGLRSLGVPAGYVAGYLRTLPPAGKPRLIGADAMHAWVRAWAGPVVGWVDYDPTNACFAGTDHIEVGFGRDYDDVAPVTGMWRLDGGQKGKHSVDLEAIDPVKDPVADKQPSFAL